MLYTCTVVGEMPAGTKFYLSEEGIGLEETDGCILIAETPGDYHDGDHLFITFGVADKPGIVSTEPPPHMIFHRQTRSEFLESLNFDPLEDARKRGRQYAEKINQAFWDNFIGGTT